MANEKPKERRGHHLRLHSFDALSGYVESIDQQRWTLYRTGKYTLREKCLWMHEIWISGKPDEGTMDNNEYEGTYEFECSAGAITSTFWSNAMASWWPLMAPPHNKAWTLLLEPDSDSFHNYGDLKRPAHTITSFHDWGSPHTVSLPVDCWCRDGIRAYLSMKNPSTQALVASTANETSHTNKKGGENKQMFKQQSASLKVLCLRGTTAPCCK